MNGAIFHGTAIWLYPVYSIVMAVLLATLVRAASSTAMTMLYADQPDGRLLAARTSVASSTAMTMLYTG